MEKERKKLVRIRKRFKTLVSPRRNVPLEIWSEIFVHAHRNSLDSTPDHIGICTIRHVPQAVQWTLGQVCRTWRDAILSMHQLWSQVFLYLPTNVAIPRGEERLNMLLRRSGRHPLCLKIVERRENDPVENHITVNARRDKLMDIIFSESHRWESVCLLQFGDSSFHRLQGRLPLLETLSIHFQCTNPQPEELPVISGFSVCPRLSKVIISGDEKDIDLSWAQIRTLDVAIYEDDSRRTGLYRCLRLAEKCHNLEHLTVGSNMMEYEPDEIDPDYMLTSHSIHKVVIIYEYILDHLILPQLQSAMVTRLRCYGDPSIASVVRTVPTSRIWNSWFFPPTARAKSFWISSLGRATVPDVVGMGEICKIMERLSPRHEPTLLPCIQDLDISIQDHPQGSPIRYFGEDDGTFVRTLETRWTNDEFAAFGTSKLKKFHFEVTADYVADGETRGPGSHSRGLLTREEQATLRKLCEDGMDLSIVVTSNLISPFQQHTVLRVPWYPISEDL